MYCHLLVPVDGTPVSDLNVERAVTLAARLDARVTFLHMTTDFAATGDGALLHVIAPRRFSDLAVGNANPLLAKAVSAAQAAGVASQGVMRMGRRPDKVITEVASQIGCDLIVMASHGLRGVGGLLHRSNTERVLRQVPIALLVTRIESSAPLSACEQALTIIRGEHRSLATVARAMRDLVKTPTDMSPADLQLLAGMTVYLRGFPRQEHHPKEELHLHRHMRSKCPSSIALLETLESQHQREYRLIAELEQLVTEALAGQGQGERLASQTNILAGAILEHIGLEEREVLPLAEKFLSEEDWSDIESAFASNTDAVRDGMGSEQFRDLFRSIANSAAPVLVSKERRERDFSQ